MNLNLLGRRKWNPAGAADPASPVRRGRPLEGERRRRYGGRGRRTILVGRPGFKPGGWRHAPPGGFDSRVLPPSFFTDEMR